MEMTDRRWIAIAVASCAVLAALRLPPNGAPRPDWFSTRSSLPEKVVAARLWNRLTDLSARASVLARRDTLLAAARANAGRTAPLMVATATLTPSERAAFNQQVATQAARIGPGARTMVLGVVKDTSAAIPHSFNYKTERQFLTPSATDGENCLAIVRLGHGRRELGRSAWEGIFGPCAFYGAFGAPGPAVESWLRGRGYDVALNAAIPERPDPNSGVLVVREATRAEELMRWLDFAHAYRALDITACAGGDTDFCAKEMRKPLTRRSERSILTGIVVPERWNWRDERPLGDEAPSFLADLLAEQGRARFEKFWKSPADLEAAFQSAFGTSTGAWTMHWMQSKYGRDTRGPSVSSRSMMLSLLAALGMVAVSAALAYRRESM